MSSDLMGPLPLTGKPLALHAFVLGYEPIPEAMSMEGGDPRRYLLEPVTAAAVEYADGWVLLDSGFNLEVVRDAALRAELLNYESYTPVVAPGDALRDAIATAGLAWDRLVACAISHAHLDHTGGVPTLGGGVQIILQRREWEWVVAGAGRREVVIGSDLLEAADRVALVEGDAEIARGLHAIDTAGHTPGHQSFVVELPSRTVVLACDAADLRANIETRTPCGWAPGAEGPTMAQAAINRLADLEDDGAEVWPGHDPEWEPWRAAARGEHVVVR